MRAWKEIRPYRTENNKYFISLLYLHCLSLHGQMLLSFILLQHFENCNCFMLWCVYAMWIWELRKEVCDMEHLFHFS